MGYDGWMRKNRVFGFTIMEMMVVTGVMSILALIAIPTYLGHRKRAFNSSALQSGKVAATAEERYYNNAMDSGSPPAHLYSYSVSLTDLLGYDANITDDPQVTFTFYSGDSSGYLFHASHARGDRSYVFTTD